MVVHHLCGLELISVIFFTQKSTTWALNTFSKLWIRLYREIWFVPKFIFKWWVVFKLFNSKRSISMHFKPFSAKVKCVPHNPLPIVPSVLCSEVFLVQKPNQVFSSPPKFIGYFPFYLRPPDAPLESGQQTTALSCFRRYVWPVSFYPNLQKSVITLQVCKPHSQQVEHPSPQSHICLCDGVVLRMGLHCIILGTH